MLAAMTDHDPITVWIENLKGGDPEAAQALFEKTYERLVRLAYNKLRGAPRRIADEEDVAASAFGSFCRAAQEGRFPELSDRHDLWRLLFEITARKAVDLIRYNARQKRRVLGESALGTDDEGEAAGFAQFSGNEPDPAFAAAMADQCGRLLDLLGDDDLRTISIAKMEGYTNAEIAEKLDCSRRTIERQLNLIRKKWEQEISDS